MTLRQSVWRLLNERWGLRADRSLTISLRSYPPFKSLLFQPITSTPSIYHFKHLSIDLECFLRSSWPREVTLDDVRFCSRWRLCWFGRHTDIETRQYCAKKTLEMLDLQLHLCPYCSKKCGRVLSGTESVPK